MKTNEIIVDNFAGGGGASTGIEIACGMPVTIAINHDPEAILMHETNHPDTRHYEEDVWNIDPAAICKGQPVGLAWFSPDCKHFSKAKGGKPVDKHIRGLAWIALRWAGMVRPRVIILENVEEFQDWGPLRRGKPIKSKKGQTFRKFVGQLRDLGYTVEWRELVAADYGVPTTRKRFYMVARCDGRPIVWPEPTHAPADSEEVKSGEKLPWRSAAEIIDWTLPCPSIFDTKEEILDKYGLKAQRPLRPNTVKRCALGLDKFVMKEPRPFLIQCKFNNEARSVSKPMSTVTAVGHQMLAEPVFTPWTVTNTSNSVGSSADDPVHTVTSAGNQMLFVPVLTQYHKETSEHARVQGLHEPLRTVDASNRYGLMAPVLTKYYGTGENVQKAGEPLSTVTARDRENIVVAHISKYFGGVVGEDISEPLPTVTAIDHNALQMAHLIKLKGQDLGQHPETPLQTVTAVPCFGVITTTVEKIRPGAVLHRWPEVREMLNTYCGYKLATDEVIIFRIGGESWFIADIGLRMLTPRELFNAQGFPPDYIIDYDYMGNKYQKSAQVARAGNAVCPPMAAALVRANLPEWCGMDRGTGEKGWEAKEGERKCLNFAL